MLEFLANGGDKERDYKDAKSTTRSKFLINLGLLLIGRYKGFG